MTKPIFNSEHPNTLLEPLEKYCVSPSSLNLHIQCPARFLWAKVFKFEGEQEPWVDTEIGIEFHKWAETHYADSGALTSQSLLTDWQALSNPFAKNITEAQGKCLGENGLEFLEPKGVEVKLASWENHRIGYVDRIDLMPDGNYCIVDYKPSDKRRFPDDVRRQLHFYAQQFNYLKKFNPKFAAKYSGGLATHGLVLGYKDSSHWLMPIKKVTITYMEKRIKKLREATDFPCFPNQPLCKFCEFATNLCLEVNMEQW